MSNTPSDEEILALAQQHLKAFAQFTGAGEVWFEGEVEFARAVLEKWGAPQPVVREPLWIDPNDKTQQQYLPHIGEPVLFCHKGTTYYGKHTGASFVSGVGFAQKHFNTWHCHWMYPPAAHDIAQKGGSNAE